MLRVPLEPKTRLAKICLYKIERLLAAYYESWNAKQRANLIILLQKTTIKQKI